MRLWILFVILVALVSATVSFAGEWVPTQQCDRFGNCQIVYVWMESAQVASLGAEPPKVAAKAVQAAGNAVVLAEPPGVQFYTRRTPIRTTVAYFQTHQPVRTALRAVGRAVFFRRCG